MEPQRNVFALVIDDDQDQYEIIRAFLTLEGYSVLTADNAADGLKLYRKYQPFVIITDFSMPELDGAELVRRFRTAGAKDTPIVIVSAYSPDYVRQHLHAGFYPETILSKPLDFELLLDTVRSYHQQQQGQLCYA
ncbi:MAG TPA: response regulator [Blastocatellia bacterium]|nr:response regulator [Blastocatellia bacterium]